MLLNSWSDRPQSLAGWVALFALAVPFTLVGEALGEVLFRNRVTSAVGRLTHTRSFSWLRIAYLFALALAVIAALWAVVHVLPPAWRIDEL